VVACSRIWRERRPEFEVSKILQVLAKEQRTIGDSGLEDWWLSSRLGRLEGARMPNASVSQTFSVESVWDEKPLGYHIGWLGVHHEQVSAIWGDDPYLAGGY
jgi:hypothetical protein